jgi:hypothetical protein
MAGQNDSLRCDPRLAKDSQSPETDRSKSVGVALFQRARQPSPLRAHVYAAQNEKMQSRTDR